MTCKHAADAFYTGELESELQRIGKEDVVFKTDKDREAHMEMVESYRRENIYPHPPEACSAECKERGIINSCIVIIVN